MVLPHGEFQQKQILCVQYSIEKLLFNKAEYRKRYNA